MGQAAEHPLTARATELLSACDLRPGAPGLAAEMLDLAVACHGRMLELGESDRPAAVALAIAGADLLRALAGQQGPGAPLPDWALIHEEQCCRYGAIWIHSLQQQNHPLSQERCQRGVGLLIRLQQLHPEPLPWIASMRQALEQACPEPASAVDLRLVLVGNGQAQPLMRGLQQALPRLQIHTCPAVHLASRDDVARLHYRLSTCDLLVMHHVQAGYRCAIGLDSATLRSLLPPAARSVVLPNLHYEGHHPWIGYAHGPDERLAALEQESPLGPYHDFLAMLAAQEDLPLERLLDPACPAAVLERLRDQHDQSLLELRSHEADCDLAISDWFASQHRHQAVVHTVNHPTQLAVDQLLRRLLQHLQLPHQLGTDLFDAADQHGALSIPIHPWVRRALHLDAWAETWGQRQGIPLPIAQQLQQSIDFYRRHPWIAAANAHHPKLQLAAALLKDSTRISQRSASTSSPSIAALINYFNDEDMLAWQLKAGCLDHYDRIYIWDGPYGYLHQLQLFPDQATRLDNTLLGRKLLADPRVVYRHRHWRDEAEKRIDAYQSVQEDLVVLHDTDEFFQLDRSALQQLWSSPHTVAAQRTQNLYAGGLHGFDAHHASGMLEGLPLKRVVFRRAAISPERHLDYCWLVGVEQHPTDETLVHPEPLWHTYHLTACRSAQGQAAKMAFYMSLALSTRGPNHVVMRLSELVQSEAITLTEAQAVFLRGDPGYAGVPNPGFQLRLSDRLIAPGMDQTTLKAILAEANSVGAGDYHLLSGYPLYAWIPAMAADQQLRLNLRDTLPLQLRSWLWRRTQPASPETGVSCTCTELTLDLPAEAEIMGRLISLTIGPTAPEDALHHVQIRING
ncbi:MAG: WcbI family polysaccharide biosynthesis putative acetyltransferase [Synechococcus sp. ELA057]